MSNPIISMAYTSISDMEAASFQHVISRQSGG
jgi:hypothetical protein